MNGTVQFDGETVATFSVDPYEYEMRHTYDAVERVLERGPPETVLVGGQPPEGATGEQIHVDEEQDADAQDQFDRLKKNLESRGFAVQAEGQELQDVEDIATDDYPEAAVENAEMALEWKEETGNPNDCGTQVGWERANQLQNGEGLSEDTINRMVSFFSRHDKGPQGQPKEDCSRMMWKAWGGDAGKRWAEDKQAEFENARENAEGNDNRGVDLEAHPEWDQHYMQMHEGIFTSPERNLLEISGSQTPEFVKTRLRETILGGALFSEFDTIPSSELMNLREYMLETLTSDGWTVDGLADQLMQLEGVENRNKAELIARTESASVVNTAREEGYKERGEDDDRFYWEGSTQSEDDRTTDACDWLVNKTNPFEGGTPVSLDRLKELIDEAPTHDPEMQNNIARPENYVVHPNERKTFVRHVE